MLLLPLLYLPPISYMALLYAAGEVQIEAHENYIKSSYRNRCEIAGANGIITLSIPLSGGRDHHQLYTNTHIAYIDNWQHRHWMSILSAYGSAPFFEHYEGHFRPFYEKQYDSLYEFNRELFSLLIRLMKLEIRVNYTEAYEKSPMDAIDLRCFFKPNDVIDKLSSAQKKWHLTEVPYIKVFGEVNALSSNLSCLDLLFNTGPGARDLLRQMINVHTSDMAN